MQRPIDVCHRLIAGRQELRNGAGAGDVVAQFGRGSDKVGFRPAETLVVLGERLDLMFPAKPMNRSENGIQLQRDAATHAPPDLLDQRECRRHAAIIFPCYWERPVRVRDSCGAGGGNRTHTPRRERDFESRASASFTTPAQEGSDQYTAETPLLSAIQSVTIRSLT